MLDSFKYQMPTQIIYGANSIKSINSYINNRKTLLLTSEGTVKRGLIQKIKAETPYIDTVISSIKSHPEFKDIENIYDKITSDNFELILAVGGGSVIDAAKFLSVQNKQKSYSFVAELAKGEREKKSYSLVPIISVPTTAGTGSELTPWATIWDMEEKKKYSLHLPDLFCEKAIYDPVLTLTIPKRLTIYTALDSLSHSLESIWNKNANPITISYAIKASKIILKNLYNLSKNLDSLEYRDEIMKACMYAGLSFSNTQTAIAHGMSYYITAHKGVPHGIACSFTLPLLIDSIIGKYDFIDKALIEIFGECSSKKIRELFQQLEISTKFEDYDLSNEEIEKLRSTLQNNQRAGNSLVKF